MLINMRLRRQISNIEQGTARSTLRSEDSQNDFARRFHNEDQ